jgi:hypothetical protein
VRQPYFIISSKVIKTDYAPDTPIWSAGLSACDCRSMLLWLGVLRVVHDGPIVGGPQAGRERERERESEK